MMTTEHATQQTDEEKAIQRLRAERKQFDTEHHEHGVKDGNDWALVQDYENVLLVARYFEQEGDNATTQGAVTAIQRPHLTGLDYDEALAQFPDDFAEMGDAYAVGFCRGVAQVFDKI